jgi:hypothetical protein
MPTTAGPTTPRGAPLEPDPTTWSVWWGYQRAGYLQVKRAVRSQPVVTGSDDFYLGGLRRADASARLDPTRASLERDVVPVLLDTLARSHNRDVATACMVALAKIGIDDKKQRLLPLLMARLTAADQEVRETAALCLGISQRREALAPLLVSSSTADAWTSARARSPATASASWRMRAQILPWRASP